MSDIEELRKKRFQFLHKLYEKTEGSQNAIVDKRKFSEEHGFNCDEADEISEYLENEDLLEHVSFVEIKITHEGVKEIEAALSHPENPTDYFPPVNIINIHHMEGSQIQQGTTTQRTQNQVMGADKKISDWIIGGLVSLVVAAIAIFIFTPVSDSIFKRNKVDVDPTQTQIMEKPTDEKLIGPNAQGSSSNSLDETKVLVERSIKKRFEVKVSLTNFTKIDMHWAPTDSLCLATFNIMNVGDVPFTVYDFFITVSLDEDGAKMVHRALDETGEKLQSVVVDPDKSSVVKAYFDIRKTLFAVPDKEDEKLTLYCNIVVEAIAYDGLRENLVFRGNTLFTTVVKDGQDYIHKLLQAFAPYRTRAIKFLGNHAKK